jgi:hypothetical protein
MHQSSPASSGASLPAAGFSAGSVQELPAVVSRAAMTSPPDDLERLLAEAPFVRELARQLVVDDPDEVVQETWLRALEQRRRSVDRPRSWLARIVRNIASNRRRAGRTHAMHQSRSGAIAGGCGVRTAFGATRRRARAGARTARRRPAWGRG